MAGQTKTEEIKVRVDALSKKALEQLARQEDLSVSSLMRRAMRELIRKSQLPING